MERLGHVIRCYDPKDRRQIRICLTENARKLEGNYQEVSDEMTRLFYKGFSDEEILRLEAGLEKVLKNFEEEEKRNDTERN